MDKCGRIHLARTIRTPSPAESGKRPFPASGSTAAASRSGSFTPDQHGQGVTLVGRTLAAEKLDLGRGQEAGRLIRGKGWPGAENGQLDLPGARAEAGEHSHLDLKGGFYHPIGRSGEAGCVPPWLLKDREEGAQKLC
jgi:hypothetical protein